MGEKMIQEIIDCCPKCNKEIKWVTSNFSTKRLISLENYVQIFTCTSCKRIYQKLYRKEKRTFREWFLSKDYSYVSFFKDNFGIEHKSCYKIISYRN